MALLAGAALLALMWWLVGRTATGADREAFTVLASSRGSLLVHLIRALSVVGPALLLVLSLAVAAGLVRAGRRPEAAVIVVGGLATLLAAHLAKAIVQRPRPHGGLIFAGGTSFPSTDAALSVLVVVLALALEGGALRGANGGRLLGAGVLVALLTGLLLIVIRVHYLTDVLAGWGLGTVVFAACGLCALAYCERTGTAARGAG